jgi:transposase
MPTKRLAMRQIHRLMGLHFGAGLGARAIGRELGISHSTVREYLARIAAANITWPLAPDITETALEQRLFANGGVQAGARRHVEPDWTAVVRELKRPGVTLQTLWEEYSDTQPDFYSYSRYCQLFREFERRLTPSMRQNHVAGDKAFVDYSGKKVPIVDPHSGEVRHAEIFVGVLGASSLTYAEASWTQALPDWIGAHVRMFKFWGAVPRLLVPDNLKSGVHRASFYDPEINRSYGAMAEHYHVGILPARPYRPRDKAKVEAGVRIAQYYVLGRLRHRMFFSLAECNAAIAEILPQLNGRVMRHIGLSRQQMFDTIERPAMQKPPEQDYEYAEWKIARVGIDYHVEAAGFFYSVHHSLIRQQVDTRLTERTVEIFRRGERVAAHVRRYHGPRHATLPEHMPSAHRRYAEWNPERFQRRASAFGPNTEALALAIMHKRAHPEQGFRTCLGVLKLFDKLDAQRVEAISAYALEIGALNYPSIASIAENRIERMPARDPSSKPILHGNIRGPRYYN